MITPRRTRLYRVADLAAFRTTLTDWILTLPQEAARDTCVIIPTGAAAEQLRRTVEDRAWARGIAGVLWPVFATRRELYDDLWSRLGTRPSLLSAFEREVLLSAVSRTLSDGGLTLPYEVRPALVAEMLALYDHVRRLGRAVDDFERNFRAELEREQDTDRGAARLLQQTTFLGAAYRGYEARLAGAGRLDEHALRELLIRQEAARPLQRVVITIGDRIAEPDGLWPADLDLLSRLPALDAIDLVCTEGVLASGYLERLYAAFPDLEETRAGARERSLPVLMTPPAGVDDDGPLLHLHRDREEELAAIARRVKQDARDGAGAPLHRTAIVVRRPLPYLYLARDVFADAAVPFETLDTLPLAAEPYAAAVDLVLDAVGSDFTRGSLLALLRTPHFAVAPRLGAGEEAAAATGAADFALADARYLGGLERLRTLVERWRAVTVPASREERRRATALPALRAVLEASDALRPLCSRAPIVTHIGTLIGWLRRFDRPSVEGEATRSRRLRVRGAVLGALAALQGAYERYDPAAEGDVGTLSAAIRRWLGGQTFAVQSGEPGLQIVDGQAARYGDFDDLQIVGLIEGEWPERMRRNALYPASLLTLLEPLPAVADPTQRERDALQSARAQFRDLVLSPVKRVRLSAFALENDAVVEPAVLVDDVPALALRREVVRVQPARVTYADALAREPRRADVLPAAAAVWGAIRLAADSRSPGSLRGEAGAWRLPRVSISRLELFLNCPFKFFAAQVMKLEELPEDEPIQTPLERGRFLHELWEQFFAEWQRRGHGRIDPDHVATARELFAEMAEEALAQLSPAEAALERQKLLGSAVDPGIAHRVFTMEADRAVGVTERLLEFALEGEFEFRTRDGGSRLVPLNAKTDRIDVLEDGTLRVIDYKSKNTPDPKVALQLPIYAHLARERLRATRGRAFTLGEALYVSFEGARPVVPLRAPRGQTLDDVIADAQDRAIRALDRIAEGQFPVQPAKKSLCGPCAYRTICRLQIVEAAGDDAGD